MLNTLLFRKTGQGDEAGDEAGGSAAVVQLPASADGRLRTAEQRWRWQWWMVTGAGAVLLAC